MGTSIVIIGLGIVSVAASVYGIYKGSKGKKADEVIRHIASEAPEIIDSAMKAITAAKSLKK